MVPAKDHGTRKKKPAVVSAAHKKVQGSHHSELLHGVLSSLMNVDRLILN